MASLVDYRQKFLGYLSKSAKANLRIPLREVHLSTCAKLSVPQESAIQQALEGNTKFCWNEAFDKSPRSTRDTEASAALVYFDTVLDVIGLHISFPDLSGQLPWDRKLTSHALTQGASRLSRLGGTDGSLAARRIFYRMAALVMRLPASLVAAATTLEEFGPLSQALKEKGFGWWIDFLRSDFRRPFAISAALNKGFRFELLPKTQAAKTTDPGSAFEQAARSFDPPLQICDGNVVLKAVTGLNPHQGKALSETGGGPLPQDFLHLSVSAEDGWRSYISRPFCGRHWTWSTRLGAAARLRCRQLWMDFRRPPATSRPPESC